jgi:hypothetical protein
MSAAIPKTKAKAKASKQANKTPKNQKAQKKS